MSESIGLTAEEVLTTTRSVRKRLDIERPVGVEGPTATIDSRRLTVTPGLRSTDATLRLELRSSRGGQHTVRLSQDAELRSVSVNGEKGSKLAIELVDPLEIGFGHLNRPYGLFANPAGNFGCCQFSKAHPIRSVDGVCVGVLLASRGCPDIPDRVRRRYWNHRHEARTKTYFQYFESERQSL